MKRHIEGLLWFAAVGLPIVAALDAMQPYLMLIAVFWLAVLVVVVPLHFYRAWKRFAVVPNRRAYAAWVGFETLATIALITVGIYTTLAGWR